MSTTVINIADAPSGWKRDPRFVYIGRARRGCAGYFGNPYRLRANQPRGATLEKFKAYMLDRIENDAEYARRVQELRGKILVCFCKPQACHGDVIAEYLEGAREPFLGHLGRPAILQAPFEGIRIKPFPAPCPLVPEPRAPRAEGEARA
ncbi:MAG: DUF4326 domain-containing protein [Planctomycetota bacterium]|nr:DUF4326 domain-containing protein [Planctomycetota bacterium]